VNIVIGIEYELLTHELHYNTFQTGDRTMAERIKAIITGYNLRAGDAQDESRNGELTNYPVSQPDAAFGVCRAALLLFLGAFVNRRGLGRVLGDGTAFNLDAADAGGVEAPIMPDIAFVSFDRLPADAWVEPSLRIAPELAVDIVSPSASAEVMHAWVMRCLDGGVSQVWLVAPGVQEILVFTPENQDGVPLTREDMLDGQGALAGFSVPVRAVFDQDNALQVEVLRNLMGG
jgi:Uma2 family endonuclease